MLYSLNIFQTKDFIESMPLFSRIKKYDYVPIANDPRFDRYLYFFQNASQYLFGGLNMRANVGYIHNLWFDVYDLAGIIPFIFLSLFTLVTLKNVFKLVKTNLVKSEFKIFIIGVYSALILQFSFEPILESVPWLFILFCIIKLSLLSRQSFLNLNDY